MSAFITDFRYSPPDDPAADFHREVISGLTATPRSIPPKYFYDELGASLFEAICEQPEYYPTTTEYGILRENAPEIARRAGTGGVLIEPGCGSCDKVRTLLEQIRPASYIPIDISCEQLQSAAATIAQDYDWLDVHAVCTDITDGLELPDMPSGEDSLVFYPGS
ncbi:MAG: L-histidine N(alpha)-methyltransferase, partial [Thiohalobacterales bacterium]|nr:L-histidine N(alpha)-methyltransferase [Thiohalobacterales bacterium]